MEHYGLALPFDEVGFFATEHHRKAVKQTKAAVQAGRLVALSGVVGAGKTVLMQRLQEELGQTVVVENLPGASGALGTTELIESEPDGHTLALITAGTTVLTPLANDVGYTKDDITPIGVMSEVPSLLAAGERSPHKDPESPSTPRGSNRAP